MVECAFQFSMGWLQRPPVANLLSLAAKYLVVSANT